MFNNVKKYNPDTNAEYRYNITPVSFFGSMQWFNQTIVPFSSLDYINILLRGISQVAFANSPISGLIIVMAMVYENPWLCFLGLWGGLLTTLFSIKLKLDNQAIRNGTIGFSGCLVGYACHLVLFKLSYSYWLSDLLLTLMLSILNIFLIRFFTATFTKNTGLPFFTLPYNASLFTFIGSLFIIVPELFYTTTPPIVLSHKLSVITVLESVFTNIAQVYFSETPYTGFAILIALCIHSLTKAFFAIVGVVIFFLVATFYGLETHLINSGIIGYNTILTTIVIGCVYYRPNFTSFIAASLAAILTTLTTIFMAQYMLPLNLPLLTIPFCLVSIVSILIIRTLPLLSSSMAQAATAPSNLPKESLSRQNT